MAKTAQQLATTVLIKLGVVDATATPAAADSNFVVDEYATKHAEWSDDDLVYWDADEIPEAVFQTVVRLMVNEVGGSFGFAQTVDEMTQRELLLLKRLRRHVARRKTGMPTRAVYY